MLFWEMLQVHLLASGVVNTPRKLHVPHKVDFSPYANTEEQDSTLKRASSGMGMFPGHGANPEWKSKDSPGLCEGLWLLCREGAHVGLAGSGRGGDGLRICSPRTFWG